MIDLPGGWRKTGRFEGWRLSRYLRRKIGAGHVLADARPRIVALHHAGNEFLVRAENAETPYYVVRISDAATNPNDPPTAFPIMDFSELGAKDEPADQAADQAADCLEDEQLFMLDPEATASPLALELWVNPIAPVRCEKILIYSGGSFTVMPLIGEDVRLAQGCSLTIAKAVLASNGYVQVDGPMPLTLDEDGDVTPTGQAISFWIGCDKDESAIWSILETPGEEFSMQRVDGDQPSVRFFSNREETETALQNRDCVFVDGRIALI